jgi:hypothetical protein
MSERRVEAIDRAIRKLGEVHKARLLTLLRKPGVTPELLARDELLAALDMAFAALRMLLARDELLAALDMAFAALRMQQQREHEVDELIAEVDKRQLGLGQLVEALDDMREASSEPPSGD